MGCEEGRCGEVVMAVYDGIQTVAEGDNSAFWCESV